MRRITKVKGENLLTKSTRVLYVSNYGAYAILLLSVRSLPAAKFVYLRLVYFHTLTITLEELEVCGPLAVIVTSHGATWIHSALYLMAPHSSFVIT